MNTDSFIINKSFSKIEFIVKSLSKFEKQLLIDKLQNKILQKDENFVKSLNIEYIKIFLVILFKNNDVVLNETLTEIISDAGIDNKTYKKIKINIKKDGLYKTIVKFYDNLIKIIDFKHKVDIEYSANYVFILSTYTELDTSNILDMISGVQFISSQVDILSSDKNELVYKCNNFLQQFINYDESIDNYYIRLTYSKYQEFRNLMNRFMIDNETDTSTIINIFEQLNKYFKHGLNYDGVYTIQETNYHSDDIIYGLLAYTVKDKTDASLNEFIVEQITNFLLYFDGETDSFASYLINNDFIHILLPYDRLLKGYGYKCMEITRLINNNVEEHIEQMPEKNRRIIGDFSEDIDISQINKNMVSTKLVELLELELLCKKMEFKQFLKNEELIEKFHSLNIFTLYKLKKLIQNDEIIEMW